MSFKSLFRTLTSSRRIATRDGLAAFLESRSAYLAQKSIMEHSQARASLMFSTLLGEMGFLDAYEKARWWSYPPAFAMVAEMAEGVLRPHAGENSDLVRQELVKIGDAVFSRFPLPAGAPARFWADATSHLQRDLAAAGLGQPKQVHLIPGPRAREIFDVLPAHANLRTHDFDMFRNTLRLHLTEIGVEFEAQADATELAQCLISEALDKR